MATSKRGTSKKKKAAKRPTKSSKKKAAKKPAKRATTSKKPKRAARRRGTSEASAAQSCRPCVVGILRAASGREPKPQMKLKNLFNTCNPDLISKLRAAFDENCTNADRNAPFTCESTVAQVVLQVCGG